jgi:hypothetical protein
MKQQKVFFGFLPLSAIMVLAVMSVLYGENLPVLLSLAVGVWAVALIFVGLAFYGMQKEIEQQDDKTVSNKGEELRQTNEVIDEMTSSFKIIQGQNSNLKNIKILDQLAQTEDSSDSEVKDNKKKPFKKSA